MIRGCIAGIAIVLAVSLSWAGDLNVKPSNVAGAFYPADPQELTSAIEGYLAQVPADTPLPEGNIVMVPHAGYMFSAPVAAYAFQAIRHKSFSTVVIIGPSHYQRFEGAAIWAQGAMETPLGLALVDESFARALMRDTDAIQEFPLAFEREHSVEVQVPFVQKIWPQAKIVPLLAGTPNLKSAAAVAQALHNAMGERDDVLVLISSDLAHYNPYEANNAKDEITLSALRGADVQALWEGHKQGTMEMCGFGPVTIGLMLAKMRGLAEVDVVRHANSGDVTGDKSQVVGYASAVFKSEVAGALTSSEKSYLLALARNAVVAFVRDGVQAPIPPATPRLKHIQGAFVTLSRGGQLRGCIGSILGSEPLAKTVRDMAIAASTRDTRFPPVTVDELKDIVVDVSVLSLPKRASAEDIVLGRDGVIISDGGEHQGIFLPQVANETGWDKETFLSELCSQKAKLGPDCWRRPDISIYTFTADVFSEEGSAHQ